MLRFGLNVSILLREYPFLERFDQAARLGFDTVEFWWPHGEDLDVLTRRIRDAGLQVALFNFDAGDLAAGERGMINDPARLAQFRAHVPAALELAAQLGCLRLNALAGKWRTDIPQAQQLAQLREQYAWLAAQAQSVGVAVQLEPLNTWDNGPCVFTTSRETLAFIDAVGAPNLQLQYDVYHMQRMEGNISATVLALAHRIGHIQIADAPGRNQPGTGELRFGHILAAIAASGYSDVIGVEYNPLGSSVASLEWLPTAQRRGPVAPETLGL
ncbi:MAG: TIM barrel protein [Kouleothrix sp.]